MTNPFEAGFLKKIQQFQADIARAQEELKNIRVEGTAAGGLVRATVNGQRELVDIKIGKEALADDDIEMLEDLIVAAVAGANEEAARKAQEVMAGAAGGILPPGLNLDGLLGGL
ncbi:MAG: YbaB/EbfC family nucleoid-associated protein [Candidatus Latescibacteria bacterium]|nr:YbaB/EbfC family nucleoid-associated protein [Candidatus Latescibacterota bacterium]